MIPAIGVAAKAAGFPWEIVSSAAGLLGGGLSGAAQMRYQRASAREAMSFSERMASTQHQREVADLRAAGLNPILSAGGSGAASPSGVVAEVPNVGGQAISTALESRRMHEEIKSRQQDRFLAHSQGLRAGVEAGTAKLLQPLLIEHQRLANKGQEYSNKVSQREAAVAGSSAGQVTRWMREIGSTLLPYLVGGGIGGAVSKFGSARAAKQLVDNLNRYQGRR